MSAKKKTPMTADAVGTLPHRYPTRWKLRQDTVMTTADAVEKLSHGYCYPTSSKLCWNNAPYLPREVIFNILIFIPAKPLFDAMRYVCKQWYDIVSDPDFVRVHCQMSTPGFLIQDTHSSHNGIHMIYIDDDTPTPNHATEFEIPFTAEVVSCFNGLVLLWKSSNKDIFHVANPLTKESISLPPLEHLCSSFKSGLAVDSCGHYKVVCASRAYNKQVKLRVFTIGIDKAWRFIDLEGIPVNSEIEKAMSYSPQSFGGFIYWFTRNYHSTSRSYGFAVDIDTENIYQFSQPDVGNYGFMFVNMGTSLGYIAFERGAIWRLWKLTDVKCGEWTVYADIDVSTLCRRFREVFDPCVNMLYNPVKLFRGQLWHYRDIKGGKALVRYNFVNDNMVIFPFKISLYDRTLLSHTNTFVSPKNL